MDKLNASDIMALMVDDGYAPPYITECEFVSVDGAYHHYNIVFIDEMDEHMCAPVFIESPMVKDGVVSALSVSLGEVTLCDGRLKDALNLQADRWFYAQK